MLTEACEHMKREGKKLDPLFLSYFPNIHASVDNLEK